VGRANNGLVAVWPRANEQGAWELGIRPVSDMKDAVQQSKALYLAGVDLVGDNQTYADIVKEVNFVVVQELFLTDTAKLANVVLPVLAQTEREGSYTSGERRVQRYYPAVLPHPGARADFAITGEISTRLGTSADTEYAGRVFASMAEKVPAFKGLTYRQLAMVSEQWPIIGRSDLYYGGTAYDNSQGLGVQLTSGAENGQLPSLAWPQEAALDTAPDSLLAVPVTRLYDRGITVLSSEILRQRIPEAYIVARSEAVIGPKGAQVQMLLNGQEVSAVVQYDESLPDGVVLVPRSLGLPIDDPQPVRLKVLVKS